MKAELGPQTLALSAIYLETSRFCYMQYVKHHSFRNFYSNIAADIEAQRLRAIELLEKSKLSDSIHCRALADLKSLASNTAMFQINQFIADEMSRLPDQDIPRYLWHRYRYDVFPKTFEIDSYPPCLQVEPSSLCNYRCVFCYQKDRKFFFAKSATMGNMGLELFKRIVDQAEGNIDFVSLASRGEPLLNPELPVMLAYTKGKFLGLKVNTNASLLDERLCHAILEGGVATLVFSVDAPKEQQYSRYRVGGKFDRVVANIRRFNQIRHHQYPRHPIIVRISGVLYEPERQDIAEMISFWSDMADQVSWVAYNPWENVYHTPPTGINAPCSDLWRRMFIWWNGQANPCDTDYKSNLSIGSILEQSLGVLWNTNNYNQLRRGHKSGCRPEVAPCANCAVT